jgi:hypothetical protein
VTRHNRIDRAPPEQTTSARVATRTVHTAEARAWLDAQPVFDATHAFVTSLPDSSEVPTRGFDGWRQWFIESAAAICRKTADHGVAIFFQTDVKRAGRWVDKGFLTSLGAEAAGSHCLWHKVVCRAPAGMTTFGRPAWAHLLCFSRSFTLEPGQSSPDVLPRLGEMPWARAMGAEACEAVCDFLLAHTPARTVIDPFCGVGTMLAVANRRGLDAIGVELSAKRAQRARTLVVPPPKAALTFVSKG